MFIINQQSELKVGDEVPSDDARMADVRKITDASVPAKERQQTWSSLLRRGGISTKPNDPTKAVVIAVVKTSGHAGQREVATLTGAESNLLAPQCHSWLAKLRSVVGAHQLGLGSGSSWTASLINTTPSTFRWNKATAADRNDWNTAVNTVFGQKPDDYQPQRAHLSTHCAAIADGHDVICEGRHDCLWHLRHRCRSLCAIHTRGTGDGTPSVG